MPYCQGPYELFSSLPSPATTTIVGARKVDYTTQRYQLDSTGNPKGMNPTAQRVLLAVAFGAGVPEPIISDRDLETRRARIEAALTDLVNERAIRDVSVLVEERAPGETYERVSFYNATTAQEESVTLT